METNTRQMRIYKAGIHQGEEPVIQGNDRSGMINFSGCHLSCRSCYTPETSMHRYGEDCSAEQFAATVDKLTMEGAKNLNLISPTHEWTLLEPILTDLRKQNRLPGPLILKISGYERCGMIAQMAALADVLVPDFKVANSQYAKRENLPNNYGQVALTAIEQMERIYGTPQFSTSGHLYRGVVVRHLMLPGHFSDSLQILETLAGIRFSGILNLMTRYLDPIQHTLISPPLAQIELLTQLAASSSIQLLVDGNVPQRRRYVS